MLNLAVQTLFRHETSVQTCFSVHLHYYYIDQLGHEITMSLVFSVVALVYVFLGSWLKTRYMRKHVIVTIDSMEEQFQSWIIACILWENH